jgi:hypothetical protein
MEKRMCVSIKLQLFSLVLSYHACATLERVDLPQKAEAPPPPSVTEFWAEQIESTDANEVWRPYLYIQKSGDGRKMAAVRLCPDAGPETRSGGNVEIKLFKPLRGS